MRDLQSGNNRGKAGGNFERNNAETLAAPIAYSGIGLHSGKEVAMKLLPGKENTGIVFVRTDLSGHPEIQA